MRGHCDDIDFQMRLGVIVACAALSFAFATGALAQQPLPPPPAAGAVSSPTPIAPPEAAPRESTPADPAPATPDKPAGTLGSIQKFFEDGAANFRSHLQGAKSKFDELGENAAANRKSMDERAAAVGRGAAEATKSAVESMTKLPTSRVAQGRERCEPASNGAPDCEAAAVSLCKKQGFQGGKSLDFTSAEECPARALLAGRHGSGECRTVTFISRAMCQ